MKILAMTCAIMALTVASSAFAQQEKKDPRNILPPGYELESFTSKWLGPGNSPEPVCAGMVAAKYPNRKYMIMSTDQAQKWRIPELHVDAQYQYSCTVMLAPQD